MKKIKIGDKIKTIKSCNECPFLTTNESVCDAWRNATVSSLIETLNMEKYKNLRDTKEQLANNVILKECHLEEAER